MPDRTLGSDQRDEARHLVDGYLRGEEESYSRVEGWVTREVSARYTVRGIEKEDLCQQIHEKLLSNLRAGRFAFRSSFRTYITSVVHHTCIDALRKKYLHRVTDLPDEMSSEWGNPYREIEKSDQVRLLHRLLHLSPEVCRKLWRMIFLENLPYGEIGRRLAIPAGTVKSRMFYCRKKALAIYARLVGSSLT